MIDLVNSDISAAPWYAEGKQNNHKACTALMRQEV